MIISDVFEEVALQSQEEAAIKGVTAAFQSIKRCLLGGDEGMLGQRAL